MPGTTTIRSAQVADAEPLLLLMRRAFAEYRGVLRPESSVFDETPDSIAGKLAAGGAFVAVEGAAMVGCVIAETKPKAGYLGRLAVDPSRRGQGLARRLVTAGEDFLRFRGFDRVELNVRIVLSGNIALFRSLGYREIARMAHPGFAMPTYLIMEKTLA